MLLNRRGKNSLWSQSFFDNLFLKLLLSALGSFVKENLRIYEE